MPDQVIGHYRILEKIGAGAMGEVFRAHDERLGRDVALKLIRPASNDNPDQRRRFELEAHAASSLNHPNIVAIYDVGFHNGPPYIVSELLEGQTLRNRLSEGALPVRLAVDYSWQIVQGLIAAHDRHITHRDLKPENLFLTNDGRVKILDFGLAKLQPESGCPVDELTTATRAGVLVGTPAYMSPEQVRSQKVDPRSDIFSMGAILYEMLTGCRAFKSETELDTMIAVAQADPPEIDLERANIPMPLPEIVRLCLHKEPGDRFQSARDLASALDPSSASEQIIRHYRITNLHRRIVRAGNGFEKMKGVAAEVRQVRWRVRIPPSPVKVLLVATLLLLLLLDKQALQGKLSPAAPVDMELTTCPAGPCGVGGTRYFQDNRGVLYYWTGMQWIPER